MSLMRFIRAIGVYLAQVILALTGNSAIAGILRALPKIWTAPARITVDDTGPRFELLTRDMCRDLLPPERRRFDSYKVQQTE